MEVLQQATQPQSQLSTRLNRCSKGVCCCGGGQGSPIPGDPASPPGSFQHSPSQPVSGLTEFGALDYAPRDNPSAELQELLAAKDPVRSASAPRRQYVGVRVKMPVCELLKKIRLSRGRGSENIEEPSARSGLLKTSGTAGKKKVSLRKRHKQSRHQTPAAIESVEDLDILVEVLQEDLQQSHAKLKGRLCGVGHHGGLPKCWSPFKEAESRLQPENSWEALRLQPHGSAPHSRVLLHSKPDSEDLSPACRMKRLDVSNTHQHPYMENRGWQWNSVIQHSAESFQDLSRDAQLSAWPSLPGLFGPLLAEDDAAAVLHDGGCSKPSPGALTGQEASALSFFQFQLYHEESRLRKIPLDKLFVPDKNGDRWFGFPFDSITC